MALREKCPNCKQQTLRRWTPSPSERRIQCDNCGYAKSFESWAEDVEEDDANDAPTSIS